MARIFTNWDDLYEFMEGYDVVVFVGADGCGKSTVVDKLGHKYRFRPYHFDKQFFYRGMPRERVHYYNLQWWDTFRTFRTSMRIMQPLVFDRSALCGAVYNNDQCILEEYSKRIEGCHVLHVLVTGEERIRSTVNSRHKDWSKKKKDEYVERGIEITDRYRQMMDDADILYVEVENNPMQGKSRWSKDGLTDWGWV